MGGREEAGPLHARPQPRSRRPGPHPAEEVRVVDPVPEQFAQARRPALSGHHFGPLSATQSVTPVAGSPPRGTGTRSSLAGAGAADGQAQRRQRRPTGRPAACASRSSRRRRSRPSARSASAAGPPRPPAPPAAEGRKRAPEGPALRDQRNSAALLSRAVGKPQAELRPAAEQAPRCAGVSCGALMTRTSRTPASIKSDSGQ